MRKQILWTSEVLKFDLNCIFALFIFVCSLFSCKCSISCQFSRTFLQQPASSIFQLWTLRGAAILLGSQPYQALLVDVHLGESLKEIVACALLFLGVVFFLCTKNNQQGYFKKTFRSMAFWNALFLLMISADYRVNCRAKLEKHLLQLHQRGTEPHMLPAFLKWSSQRSSAVWSKSWEYSHGWSIAESGFQSGWTKEIFMVKSSSSKRQFKN